MARKRRSNDNHPIGVGLTTRQTKRKKPISGDYLVNIEPLTENQSKLFDAYKEGKHLVAYGAAGTGKTFITLYNALRDVFDETTPYEQIYVVRSLVATREIGFLPGDHDDKSALYQIPYKNMVKYMFQMPSDADFEMLYGNLKSQETVKFWSTSFIRGTTLDNSIIIIDEMQYLKLCYTKNFQVRECYLSYSNKVSQSQITFAKSEELQKRTLHSSNNFQQVCAYQSHDWLLAL